MRNIFVSRFIFRNWKATYLQSGLKIGSKLPSKQKTHNSPHLPFYNPILFLVNGHFFELTVCELKKKFSEPIFVKGIIF
jgi:hypothetical protein